MHALRAQQNYKVATLRIISFYLNAVNPPTPESMFFEIKERLEGLKHIGFFGGWGTQREGVGMSTVQKGAILRKCLNTLVFH